MELKQLSYFVIIVEEGNISKAAKRLHMSQPPLSTQIKLLEQELGCSLFTRGARSIQLTYEGMRFYQRAITILDMAGLAKQECTESSNLHNAILRIGIVTSLGNYFPDNILPDFFKNHSNISYELTEANTYQLIEKLKSNLLELAIIRTPFTNDMFDCIYLQDEPLYAIGQKELFSDIDTDEISLLSLNHIPLIIYRRWKSILDTQFRGLNIYPTYRCICDDARTTVAWAKSGLGVGIIPESAIPDKNDQTLLYQRIADNSLHSQIAVIYQKKAQLSNAALSFLQYMESIQD